MTRTVLFISTTRRLLFSCFRILLLLPLILLLTCGEPEEPIVLPPNLGPPNVLLIVADDWGYGDLGIHGNDTIRTPRLDSFFRQGTEFERFYVSPLGMSTRAALLTGRYAPRTGVIYGTGGGEILADDELTMAEAFGAAGYSTALFGKWHNGVNYPTNPAGQGFNSFLGFVGGSADRYFNAPLENERGEPVITRGYLPDILTDSAAAFMETAAAGTGPFFGILAYPGPHAPLQVPDKYFNHYRRALDDEKAAVYGMIENLDHNIGRLLTLLEKTDRLRNTIVIVTSDNGPAGERFNLGLRGRKGRVDEGGTLVPFAIRFPATLSEKYPNDRIVSRRVSHVDVLPTLAALLGLDLSAVDLLDGKSLVPLLVNTAGDKAWPNRSLFTFSPARDTFSPYPGALRTDQYLYIIRSPGNEELYDLQTDPTQQTDLALERPVLLDILAGRYADKAAEVSSPPGRAKPVTQVGTRFPLVRLLAIEARLSKKLRYSRPGGPTGDWAEGWSGPADTLSWKLAVVDTSRYALSVAAWVPPSARGTELELAIGNTLFSVTLNRSFSPTPPINHDRVPRTEPAERDWAMFPVDTIRLSPGEQQLLRISPRSTAGSGLAIKGVYLQRVD